MSEIEETLALQLRGLKITGYEREYRFAAHHVGLGKGVKQRLKEAGLRDFRFDFAWPEIKFAVEVHGGGWMRGRTGHTSGAGFARDLQKAHDAMSLGWTLYACDGSMVKSGQAVELIEELINNG